MLSSASFSSHPILSACCPTTSTESIGSSCDSVGAFDFPILTGCQRRIRCGFFLSLGVCSSRQMTCIQYSNTIFSTARSEQEKTQKLLANTASITVCVRLKNKGVYNTRPLFTTNRQCLACLSAKPYVYKHSTLGPTPRSARL